MEYLMRDRKLTQMTKNIFGEDIVDYASVAIDSYEQAEHSAFRNVNSEIDFAGCDIVIKFKNGNLVGIHTSEWCFICRTNEQNYVKLEERTELEETQNFEDPIKDGLNLHVNDGCYV